MSQKWTPKWRGNRLQNVTPKGYQKGALWTPPKCPMLAPFLDPFWEPFGGDFFARKRVPKGLLPNLGVQKKNDSRSSLVHFFVYETRDSEGSKNEPKTDPQMASKIALKRHPENRNFENLFWTHFGHLLGSFWGAFWASFGLPQMVNFWLHFGGGLSHGKRAKN